MSIAILVAYICGSIPFGLIISNIFGNGRLREQGSGNIGATNVVRTQGKLLGGLTFLLDGIKGGVPFLLFPDERPSLLFAIAVFGHMFPVWLKFKGGKGIATFLGALLFWQPYIAIISMCSWFVIFKTTRISSLSGLGSVLIGYIIFAVYCKSTTTFDTVDFVLFSSVILAIFVKHTDNIKRLINKEEKSL